MAQDFRTIQDHQVFGVRATALIVRDGQIYLTRDGEDRYYTIGGAIQVGEKTEDAVKREVREEVGVEVEVGDLAFVVENNFYQGERIFHTIEFHYLVTPLSEPNLRMFEDEVEQICEWIPIDRLTEINLVPSFLKRELPIWKGKILHIKAEDS